MIMMTIIISRGSNTKYLFSTVLMHFSIREVQRRHWCHSYDMPPCWRYTLYVNK